MPWLAPKFVEFGDFALPSFFPNNLAGDGEGRFAFAHGGRVQCTRRHRKRQGSNGFTLAMRLVSPLSRRNRKLEQAIWNLGRNQING